MKEYLLHYGKGARAFELDESRVIGELLPNPVKDGVTGEAEVRRAVLDPIGSPRLRDQVKPGDRVVIITSDMTRPMPSSMVTPVVIEELLAGGVNVGDITVVFAIGSHRRHSEAEKECLVGTETYHRVRCVDSDPDDCVNLGLTKRGTPVDVFREVALADVRVCLGNIEYHWFAGYSGGAKAIMPGVSTRGAIQSNHKYLVSDDARAGEMDHNPVRIDIEDAAGFVPIHFIVNVVLDENKTIIKAVAGHHVMAHREGCRFLDLLYKVVIREKADIVIVSAGGYPKDLNLYQAQKALDNARHAIRSGGIVIWVAQAQEGLGEEVFKRWILSAKNPEEILERIQVDFQLGGHKAAGIASVLVKAGIFLVSDLDPGLVRRMFMHPFEQIGDALDEATRQLGDRASVILMPVGGSTLPVVATT